MPAKKQGNLLARYRELRALRREVFLETIAAEMDLIEKLNAADREQLALIQKDAHEADGNQPS